jgi:hypothetical protein
MMYRNDPYRLKYDNRCDVDDDDDDDDAGVKLRLGSRWLCWLA